MKITATSSHRSSRGFIKIKSGRCADAANGLQEIKFGSSGRSSEGLRMPRPGFRFPGWSRELVTAGALGGDEAGEEHRSPGTLPCTLPMSKGTSRTDARAGRQRCGDGCRTGAGLQEGRGQLCSTEASGVSKTFRCPAMLLDTPPPLHLPQALSSAPARGLFLQLGLAWGPGLGRLFPPGHCCKHQGPWHTCFHLGTSDPRMLFSRPLRARGSSTKSRCSYLLHTSLNKAHVSPAGASRCHPLHRADQGCPCP